MNPMHISRIDLNLFVVFDAVLAEGSITAASRKLHLSQPAVSHALKRLRGMLADPLFERAGRGMVPTPRARAIAPEVRAALARLQQSLNYETGFDPKSTPRRFAIAMRDMLEIAVIPNLSSRILESTSDIEIATVRLERRRLANELATGAADLAVDVLLPPAPDVRAQRLVVEPMVVMGRRAHPLLQASDFRLEDYLGAGHIQISSRRNGPGIEDIELARRGIQRRISLRCRQYATACRTVAATDLLATMPARHARIVNLGYDNLLVPLPLPGVELELYLYWHLQADKDPANRWLREQLIAALTAV